MFLGSVMSIPFVLRTLQVVDYLHSAPAPSYLGPYSCLTRGKDAIVFDAHATWLMVGVPRSKVPHYVNAALIKSQSPVRGREHQVVFS